MSSTESLIWSYGGIDVIYSEELDGCGTWIAPAFVTFIKNYFGPERRFGTVFDWCAGPGFIGFALLAEGLCESVCLADINPAAIDCAERTIETNKLRGRVRTYVSDNLTSVPQHERFDLVVGNPPCFYSLNPEHPIVASTPKWLSLIAEDAGWKIHAGFYGRIASFLTPNAYLLVQEVEPSSREVYIPPGSGVPVDTRSKEPAAVFPEMMSRGGLTHVGDFELHTSNWSNIRTGLQVSRFVT